MAEGTKTMNVQKMSPEEWYARGQQTASLKRVEEIMGKDALVAAVRRTQMLRRQYDIRVATLTGLTKPAPPKR